MSPDETVYLMYHELELPNRALCQADPGYVRYIVSANAFREQMLLLKTSGRTGINVGDALAHPRREAVAVTFDDGCETDLIAAAPILAELGFSGTFYITVGFLDKPGFLTRKQLRELSDLGYEIGSHSWTHPYLSDLPDPELEHEIAGSRRELEQMIGRPVWHFSCPGGRWNQRVARSVQQAGYRSMTISRVSANTAQTNPFELGRVAMMRGTPIARFQDLSEGRGLLKIRLTDSARGVVKRVLGNSFYDRVRSAALRF
jgi:peptidoglycan/xylan/chitin deacetylase (PgdA/CDA1 family)